MSAARTYTKADLLEFKPRHDSFVGIDSDGCIFPTMEIKQNCSHGALSPCGTTPRQSGAATGRIGHVVRSIALAEQTRRKMP
jgi:hypothetical protein